MIIIFLDLSKERRSRGEEYRTLLLGCGEAGKSTFIKQMRIIHSEGFPDEEKKATKTDIADNIMSAIMTLLKNLSFVEEEQLHSDPDLHKVGLEIWNQSIN
jgi:guanine nucleotide-binding protein G(q) subunit alpha